MFVVYSPEFHFKKCFHYCVPPFPILISKLIWTLEVGAREDCDPPKLSKLYNGIDRNLNCTKLFDIKKLSLLNKPAHNFLFNASFFISISNKRI